MEIMEGYVPENDIADHSVVDFQVYSPRWYEYLPTPGEKFYPPGTTRPSAPVGPIIVDQSSQCSPEQISSDEEVPVVKKRRGRSAGPISAKSVPAPTTSVPEGVASTSATTSSSVAPVKPGEVLVSKALLEAALSALNKQKTQLDVSLRGIKTALNLPSTSAEPEAEAEGGDLLPDWPVPGPTDTDCPVCMVSCRTPTGLKHHMERHTKKGSRVCAKCGKCYTSMENFRAHYQACVIGVKEYHCSQCNKLFTTQRTLTIHKGDIHAPPGPPEERKCPYCYEVYDRRRLMLSHKTACKQRPGKKDYPCIAGCGSSYSRNRDMLKHLRDRHPEYQ